MKINKYEKERRKDEDDCYCAHRDQGCDATTSPIANFPGGVMVVIDVVCNPHHNRNRIGIESVLIGTDEMESIYATREKGGKTIPTAVTRTTVLFVHYPEQNTSWYSLSHEC
mmetsp:Transcript_19185/g.20630  ORF Transcript_19185/g.20630 Transcript_19185/m.20630 type:complete len:112 (+) Transcript_19185:455-790(+)